MTAKWFVRFASGVLLCAFMLGVLCSSETIFAQADTQTVEGDFSLSQVATVPCTACVPPSSSGKITVVVDYTHNSVKVTVSGQGAGQATINLCIDGKPTNQRGTAQGQSSFSGTITGSFDPETGKISAKGTVRRNSSVAWIAGCSGPQCQVMQGQFTDNIEVKGVVRREGFGLGTISKDAAGTSCKSDGEWSAHGNVHNSIEIIAISTSPAEPTTADKVVTATVQATSAVGVPLTYKWKLDGQDAGTGIIITLPKKLHDGKHTLNVFVTDGLGGSAEKESDFYVHSVCQEFCGRDPKQNEEWDGGTQLDDCTCICKKDYGRMDGACTLCDDVCKSKDSRASADKDKCEAGEPCACKCQGALLEYSDNDNICKCVSNSHPEGNTCKCNDGFKPDSLGAKCIPIEGAACDALCKNQLGKDRGVGKGDPETGCECNCLYPYVYRGTGASAQCQLADRETGPDDLKRYLAFIGYHASNCKSGIPQPGSVIIWSGSADHSALVLPDNQAIEMGWKVQGKNKFGLRDPDQNEKDYESSIRDVTKPAMSNKGEPLYLENAEVLCPPPGTLFPSTPMDKNAFMNYLKNHEAGTARNFDARDATKWNCHGFTAHLIATYLNTGVKVSWGSDVAWQGNQLIVMAGRANVNRDPNKFTEKASVGFKSGGKFISTQTHYAVEVGRDQSISAFVFDGAVQYQKDSYAILVSAGQMVTINPAGVPSSPTNFDPNTVDKWWEVAAPPVAIPAPTVAPPTLPGPAAPQVPSNIAILSGLAIAGAMLLILAGGIVAIIAAVSTRARPSVAPPPTVPGSVAPNIAARLDIARGSANVSTLSLARQGATVGRDASNALVLSDQGASRQHARVCFENGTWVIYDLNSSNGTFVNRTRITRQPLHDGDQIQIGQTLIVFRG